MRHRTGKGQHIDIAMIDATVATDDQLHYDLEDAIGTGPMPNEIWESGIGPVLLSTDFRMFFRSLTTLGLEDPSNPEMELEEKINVRRKAVGDFLNTLDTREKFSAAMKSVNVAWGEVRSPENLQDQLTVKARGAITDIDDRNGGTRPITQSPYRFSAAKSGVRGPVAHRGEDFDEVLKGWLSMDDQDISQLREDNVIVYDRKWRHH